MQTRPLVALLDEARRRETEAILRSCVHCGFCNATCPTYQLLGDERDGPRGRIYLIKQVLEGIPATQITQRHLDRCLTCRACETTCPSGVAYGQLLDTGREIVEQQVGRSLLDFAKRQLLCAILPYRHRFAVFYRFARFFAPIMPHHLRKKFVCTHATKPDRLRPAHARRVLLLDGCVQPTLAPGINHAAIRVLDKLDIGVVLAPTAGCCGALSYHLSAQQDGLDFMRRNIDAWLPYIDQDIQFIVTTASGCGLMVKDYGKLLKHNAAYKEKAEQISAAARDIVEILTAEELTGLKPQTSAKLAFQSPCTLQHGQQLNGRVETLLSRLGFELMSVPDPHLCCGSAGTYSLMQPELSEQLLKNKIRALETGQPDIIVTANIGCQSNLQSATTTPVRHWIEVLSDAVPD
ncbi:MAG: glycolate oxidase subunit GlcF [Methylococcaceae bacterium]|nr:glycolate oxidase subunit GlcF [Methylococcaceae bacterium]